MGKVKGLAVKNGSSSKVGIAAVVVLSSRSLLSLGHREPESKETLDAC